MSILDERRERVMKELAGQPVQRLVARMELEGIRASLDNLRTFPCVQILEGKGRLHLHGAYFDIASGTLEVLNPSTDAYVKL
ncbi:MAG: carbonic anhydrase, partial [Hyphomicrobiaceae bacterium]